MSSALPPDNTAFPADRFGGKGAALHALSRAGFPVPPFVLLPHDELQGRTVDELADDWADKTSLFDEPGTRYAVRSSAIGEDGAARSFAGQFKTLLNVPFADVPAAVADVCASARSATVQAYVGSGGLGSIAMAVVVQRMVPATVSGVAFGAHPVSGEDVVVVNATAGLGEALVSGEVTGEEYIVEKGRVVISAPEAGMLSAQQLSTITGCMARLQTHFGRPQDAEFAFVGEEFFLLQSRPITTVIGERIVWDNSNIVESYPGITLPLTYSFIEKMYAAVYRQFSLVLGVSPARVARVERVYQSMLGHLNGRVYYNLNSWYRALAQLPGYSLNASFMEKMMGVKDKPDIDLGPAAKTSRIGGWLQVTRALGAIFKNLRGARRGRTRFEEKFNRVHAEFAGRRYDGGVGSAHGLTLQDILHDYAHFESLMVKEWKAPLVNDFFAMIYFGLLQKQCAKIAPDDTTLHNRLLAASGDVATTAPLKRLPALAAALAAAPALRAALLQHTPEAAWQLLRQPEHAAQKAELDHYLADWGERVAEELKLETVSYADDPVKLLAVMQGYVRAGIFHGAEENAAERNEAETLVRRAFRGKPIARQIFNHILRQARYFVSNRENLRYYRTRGFTTVRRMMLAAGKRLTEEEKLEAPRDIFYLTLDEVQSMAREQPGGDDVKALVCARRKEYENFVAAQLPERITTWGTPRRILIAGTGDAVASTTSDALRGIPCSAGIVRARIRKVLSVEGVADLERSILATYATDPGYVVLFPSAAGILTERGSLLSHAAIVSREMNIPCIVGIDGLMAQLRDGDWVEMDGSTGAVTIVNSPAV